MSADSLSNFLFAQKLEAELPMFRKERDALALALHGKDSIDAARLDPAILDRALQKVPRVAIEPSRLFRFRGIPFQKFGKLSGNAPRVKKKEPVDERYELVERLVRDHVDARLPWRRRMRPWNAYFPHFRSRRELRSQKTPSKNPWMEASLSARLSLFSQRQAYSRFCSIPA